MADCEQCAALLRQNDFLANDRDGYVQLLTNDNNKLRAEIASLTIDLQHAHGEVEFQTDKVAIHGEAVTRLRAEVEKLRAALEPFADMGRAMMGRKHPNEAVVQYALAPTIKVFHLVAAHEARAATPQEPTAADMPEPDLPKRTKRT